MCLNSGSLGVEVFLSQYGRVGRSEVVAEFGRSRAAGRDSGDRRFGPVRRAASVRECTVSESLGTACPNGLKVKRPPPSSQGS